MPIFSNKPRKVERRLVADDRVTAKAKPQPRTNTIRPPVAYKKKVSNVEADIAILQQGLAQAAAETQTTRIADGPAIKERGGTYQVTAKPLPSASNAQKSYPGSPALSGGFGSPLSQQEQEEGRKQVQEVAKQQRSPLIHELAVRDKSFAELLEKWEGVEEDLPIHLKKVAFFDEAKQQWSLNKPFWKELDPYKYAYQTDEDRQKAIDNAIRQYDRMRLGVSDPLWQKLLPKQERGKGICLSKLQASLAKGSAAPPPKINVQKPEATSPSGHSERSDSASSSGKMAKGGEAMARTNSGNKPKKVSASEAQAKRLMNKPSAAAKAAAAKPALAKPSPKIAPTASPKISPTKSTAKAPTGKGGRVLSKEFISDSDSDGSGDEAAVSTTISKAKPAQKERPTEKARNAEKPKATDRIRDSPAPASKPAAKAKPAPAPARRPSPVESKPAPARRPSPVADKVKDTITAEAPVQPRPTKRPREDDDDSSSSGALFIKRAKSKEQMATKAPATQPKGKEYLKSGSALPSSSRMSRTSSSGTSSSSIKSQALKDRPSAMKTPASAPATKTTSPVKSSPLASSPPTNVSDSEERRAAVVSKKRKQAAVESYEERRERNDSSDSSGTKRRKLSPETITKANEFKQFYAKYEALHKEIMSLDYPPADKLATLNKMHTRLASLKEQIYNETME